MKSNDRKWKQKSEAVMQMVALVGPEHELLRFVYKSLSVDKWKIRSTCQTQITHLQLIRSICFDNCT